MALLGSVLIREQMARPGNWATKIGQLGRSARKNSQLFVVTDNRPGARNSLNPYKIVLVDESVVEA